MTKLFSVLYVWTKQARRDSCQTAMRPELRKSKQPKMLLSPLTTSCHTLGSSIGKWHFQLKARTDKESIGQLAGCMWSTGGDVKRRNKVL